MVADADFEEGTGATQVVLLGGDLLLHPLGLRLQLGEVFLEFVDAEAVEVLGLRLLLARLQVFRVHRSGLPSRQSRAALRWARPLLFRAEIGRASWRERVCQYV